MVRRSVFLGRGSMVIFLFQVLALCYTSVRQKNIVNILYRHLNRFDLWTKRLEKEWLPWPNPIPIRLDFITE